MRENGVWEVILLSHRVGERERKNKGERERRAEGERDGQRGRRCLRHGD